MQKEAIRALAALIGARPGAVVSLVVDDQKYAYTVYDGLTQPAPLAGCYARLAEGLPAERRAPLAFELGGDLHDDADECNALYVFPDGSRAVLNYVSGAILPLDAFVPTVADRSTIMTSMKYSGITAEDCISVLSVPNDNPYVTAARRLAAENRRIRIPADTVTSEAEKGAMVLAWFSVSDEEANVFEPLYRPFEVSDSAMLANGTRLIDIQLSESLTDKERKEIETTTNDRFERYLRAAIEKFGPVDRTRYDGLLDSFVERVVKACCSVDSPATR
jgi:hypothetical protein